MSPGILLKTGKYDLPWSGSGPECRDPGMTELDRLIVTEEPGNERVVFLLLRLAVQPTLQVTACTNRMPSLGEEAAGKSDCSNAAEATSFTQFSIGSAQKHASSSDLKSATT